MKEVVNILLQKQKTIATMESCTGGSVVNEITNIEGSSNVLCFSAVTYSNEYKIKMGVDKKVIDKYSVYSRQTANEMSKAISNFANADYGIGITGKLNRIDENNLFSPDNKVFISIYDKQNNEFINDEIIVSSLKRSECKKEIVDLIIKKLLKILN